MNYRSKLFVGVIALVVITNVAVAGTSYYRGRKLLQIEIHRKVRSIAEATAALIPVSLVQAIHTRADENRPEYARLRQILERVRNVNRRGDAWVTDVFTLIPAPQDAHIVEYGVDSEKRFRYVHHAGDIYERHGEPLTIGIGGINQLAKNAGDFQAGFASAFAPIRDPSGKLVAELGVTAVPAPHSTLTMIGPEILLVFAITLLLALIIAAFLSREMTKPLYALRHSIDSIGRGDLNAEVPLHLKGEFAEIGAAISLMLAGLKERDTIKRAFSGYISRQVMEAIMAKGDSGGLKGERRRVTVLFADIRGFTAMSEKMRPEEVVELLSEFFDCMVEVVLRNHGTIDKFLGDGMMVIFGAPLDDSYQEEHAVTAALEMQARLRELCLKWQVQGRPAVRMGIGINSGSAVVGNIGSTEHMEYTAIGDTVNLASRLEAVTKELGLDIIVSENTYEAARPLFKWNSTGEVRVRGRIEPVRTYAVEGVNGARVETATS
ncbi:MAG: adenylate/guanylate cyclase domain-containing protein [Candidatus Binataceae bacterium]